MATSNVTPIDGGASGPPDGDSAAWREAWTEVHAGFERGLTVLGPSHPRRGLLLACLRDSAECAGLPCASTLREAGGEA